MTHMPAVAGPLPPIALTEVETDGISATGVGTEASPIVSRGPYVDLRLPPYSVVAGSTSAAAANTAAINSAITTYSGTRATLVLPNGTIYVDRANGTDNWCIKFASGVTDVDLIGQGMYATTIAEYAAGDGGGSYTVMFDQCSRCAIHDLAIYQDTITSPDSIQDNHLIGVVNTGAGTTKDIRGWNIYFGKSVGDQLRFLGDTTIIQDCFFHDLVMHGAGTVTSSPANGRVGSRSCISFQRNYRRIRLDNIQMDGAQNTPFDHEPTGVPTEMDQLHASNIWIDNTVAGVTEAAASFGGVSAGVKATRARLENFHIKGGTFNILQTSALVVDGMQIVADTTIAGNAAASLFLVRQTNDDLVIRNTVLERNGGTAGLCFDIENQGTRTTMQGCRVVQATTANPITTDLCAKLTMEDITIDYSGGSPTAHDAINIKAVSGNCDDMRIQGIRLTSSSKMEACIRVDTRTARTANRIKIRDIQCAGSALYGVYLSATAGTIDTTPELSGIANGSDDVWKQTDAADAPVTTMFPIVAGNRADIAHHVSEATPEGALTAIQGSTCVYKNGSSTKRYFKLTGTTNTGWVIEGGVVATGSITCTTKANYSDSDYMTIGDGFVAPKLYEFDTAGDGVTAGRVQVNISGATTAADVAAILKTAIEANQPLIAVTDAGSGVLTLAHKVAGVVGNVTITENVANAGHTVSGMSGGVNPAR